MPAPLINRARRAISEKTPPKRGTFPRFYFIAITTYLYCVMLAQAGIHCANSNWIPDYSGMTQ